MLLKVLPAFVEERFVNMNHLNVRCGQQVISGSESFVMLSPAVEKRHDLIKDVRSGYQRERCLENSSPVMCGLVMVLVVGDFECDYKVGIEKERGHSSP